MILSLLLSTALIAAPPQVDGGYVSLKGRAYIAEIARGEKERELGLAYRNMFPSNHCMFVVQPEEGLHPIQTRKWLLSFDAIWVDEEGRVVETAERMTPCKHGQDCPSYGGKTVSRHVVFLPTGTVRSLNLKSGDPIRWDLHFADGTSLLKGSPILETPSPSKSKKVKKSKQSQAKPGIKKKSSKTRRSKR